MSRRRAILACACAVGAAVAAPATTDAAPRMWSGDTSVPDSKWRQDQRERKYMRLHAEAGRMGGDPGRNILVWGVDTRDGDVREPKRAELRRSIRILERMTTPVQPAVSSSAPSASYSAAPAGNGTLDGIAACESGGDPTAVGGGGLYRGKYQFTYETWQSVGGTGDPAAAPEAEQDARAAMLLERDGAGHWPVCGG